MTRTSDTTTMRNDDQMRFRRVPFAALALASPRSRGAIARGQACQPPRSGCSRTASLSLDPGGHPDKKGHRPTEEVYFYVRALEISGQSRDGTRCR